MALSDLYQLDPVGATSNSNIAGSNVAENCPASGINNAIRALASITARAISYQSAAISSSVSTNLATASSGLAIAITGANAVNSFGVVPGEQPSAAVLRIVEFSSSASLSHGGSIFLTGGASRKTQPGDVGIYLHQGSSDRWKEIAFSRADGTLPVNSVSVTSISCLNLSAAGTVSATLLNVASVSATAIGFTTLNATSISASVVNAFGSFNVNGITTVQTLQRLTQYSSSQQAAAANLIPSDNTTPLSGEGALAFSQTVTPKNASSIIRISGLLNIGTGTAAQEPVAVLFRDTTCLGYSGVTTHRLRRCSKSDLISRKRPEALAPGHTVFATALELGTPH